MPPPALPILPYLSSESPTGTASALTRKFGPETANYFSGSPLNRLSWLRSDHLFLRAAFSHPSAKFLLMNSLGPMVSGEDDQSHLGFASVEDVKSLLGSGEEVFKSEEEVVKGFDSEEVFGKTTGGGRGERVVIFLGVELDDSPKGEGNTEKEDGQEGKGEVFEWKGFRGTPYFAVDVTPREADGEQGNAKAEELIKRMEGEGKGHVFLSASPRGMGLEAGHAAMYGQARALIDWNARNPFCAQCGQRTISVHAGTKRVCPPTDKGQDRAPCATRGTVSNLSFPRTDPTVIMAIVSADGTKVLLGRQRRWPQYWYSTLAGFQEPGESIEEAVRREVWEESGVTVGRVVLHSSQPWPFPASLMIGAIGQAVPGDGEKIFLGHDAELEDAKWFPLEEVKEALHKGASNMGESAPEGYVEGALRLPPQTAIANRLINAVVEGWWTMPKI
ncbi:NUDIX hydrolase domain-like protein [Pseudoneurospora amorphoporcata]|uniref:NAD(+) diphosphatase n=1 Tax=Pseudoneurospora amorphoporcata TaxID=241081 RepID=A0AAN6SIH4_9PEZI|nr:NUDIX hydrolase domain-like protein [Pseudoneurospora amorphoporcata]